MSSQEYEPEKLYSPQGFLKALVKEFQEITRHYTHPGVSGDIENSGFFPRIQNNIALSDKFPGRLFVKFYYSDMEYPMQ